MPASEHCGFARSSGCSSQRIIETCYVLLVVTRPPEGQMANSIRRRNVVMLAATAATLPITWPLAVVAQQPKPPMIGYLDWHAPPRNSPFLEAFRAGLAEAGLIEGRNLLIEYRWANGNLAQLPDMAADLV